MVLILTGPPAAGKSTLGPLIAKQLKRCAVIDVDWVRVMVVQPHLAPWLGEEGMAQLRLGARNACALGHCEKINAPANSTSIPGKGQQNSVMRTIRGPFPEC